ncbi:DUF3137 domain-containing protein [Paludisphaera borealis]|uniref:DUF3137 domain-containing protein n=1 Tax=Paludisphaera borealis TaxID=1387353 RepID=A0A1U7CJN0_9BACT|nr:DUF3137 domain-containing protein [Paludisphaera borealis]APW59150.1 hypothetical protein BSF38_00564 [Paludisphaera borealis]
MGWFGPSQDEVWGRLSEEIGAQFMPGGFWKRAKVQKRVDQWTILLDTFTRQHGQHHHVVYTRLRAPFVNPDGFRFTVYRAGFLSGLGKYLGMQDVEIGDPEFDDAFVVKGNDESRLVDLFADPKLRELLASLPRMRVEVKDSEGWFGPSFPPDADELYFTTRGVLKDLDQLKGCFAVFSALLHRLCVIGAAHKYDPGVRL